MIEPGTRVPEFTLIDQDEKDVSLGDFAGRKLLLYFYPKDDTSGCTAQACDLRDGIEFFRDLDVQVVGVSPDSAASHRKFRKKYDLNFPLLVDDDHELAEAFGVWKEKKMYGRSYMGIERSTFLIGEDGTLIEAWRNVSAKEHAEIVRDFLGQD